MAVLNDATWQYATSNDEALQNSFESRVLTGIGEYVGLEGYGNTLVTLLGDFFDESQRQLVVVEVTRSVDDILDLESVQVEEVEPGTVKVTVNGKFDVVIQ